MGTYEADIAASLRRIADALERITTPAGLAQLLLDLQPVFDQLEAKRGKP